MAATETPKVADIEHKLVITRVPSGAADQVTASWEEAARTLRHALLHVVEGGIGFPAQQPHRLFAKISGTEFEIRPFEQERAGAEQRANVVVTVVAERESITAIV